MQHDMMTEFLFVPQPQNSHWTIHSDIGGNRDIRYFSVVFKNTIPTLNSNLSLLALERRLLNLIHCSLDGCAFSMSWVFLIDGQFLSPCITRYLSLLGQFSFFLKSEIRNSRLTTDRRYIGLNNI
jgi:hypothetical protein